MFKLFNFKNIAPYVSHPLVLIGFLVFLILGIHKILIKSGILKPISQADTSKVLFVILRYGFIISIVIILLGFTLEGIKYYHKLKNTDPTIINNSESKERYLLLLDMAYHIYIAGLGGSKEIQEDLPEATAKVQEKIIDFANELNLTEYSKNIKGKEVFDFYNAQLQAEKDKYFFKLGIKVGMLHSMKSVIDTHPNDKYSILAFDNYKDESEKVKLLLVEYGLDNSMDYIPGVIKENEGIKMNGSFDLFLAKLKAEIRSKISH